MHEETSGTGIGIKLIAFVALLVCAWILLKVVIGIVTTVAWVVVVVGALFGLLWAWSKLRD
jgi:membrane associated rhomboid family serine protease